MNQDRAGLPAYAQTEVKRRLLATGASGTIYALVMPESEAGIQYVVDGCDPYEHVDLGNDPMPLDRMMDLRDDRWLSTFREPWLSRQDDVDAPYFEKWISWSSPVVDFDAAAFPHRYPTAGGSEGIYKLMAGYRSKMRAAGLVPTLSVFRGEYEGFTKFAEALGIEVHVHDRHDLEATLRDLPEGSQFWISQPSAIDGMVWDRFDEFLAMVDARTDVEVVPDLTYVGSVARSFRINLDHRCIDSFVFSQSKPFGGYYHRAGGVFSRDEQLSLVGNKWFKNLTSIAWGRTMMERHGVHDLPSKYRPNQVGACARVGRLLGIEGLRPADVAVIATAPVPEGVEDDEILRTLVREVDGRRILRVCLTPDMSASIDPDVLAPITADMILASENAWLSTRLMSRPSLNWWNLPAEDPTNDILALKERAVEQELMLSLTLDSRHVLGGLVERILTIDDIDPRAVHPDNLAIADEIIVFDEAHGVFQTIVAGPHDPRARTKEHRA